MDEPRVSDFKFFYEVERRAFASGLYASVRRARSRKTGHLYAAKFSPKRKENYNEIRLLSRLRNNYIITFRDAFVTDKNLITIMEFAPGGDLQSVIDADIVLPELQASKYITQLLHGLDYLHAKSIAHLDIKPQNLLLMGDFPECQIKICDFELSRVVGNGEKEVVGTPDYVAPEILTYTALSTKADIWSTGIVTYVLLTGFSPFGGDSDAETFNNILNTEIDFPNELFDDIGLPAMDFIRALLEKNPRSRPTANFALTNDWLKAYRTRPKNKSKSTFDLSGGKTKSREKLMQRVVGAGLRKTMSKSREQLWKSKMQLSASSEKIARWASVSEFPSLNDDGIHGSTIIPEDITKNNIAIIPRIVVEETEESTMEASSEPPMEALSEPPMEASSEPPMEASSERTVEVSSELPTKPSAEPTKVYENGNVTLCILDEKPQESIITETLVPLPLVIPTSTLLPIDETGYEEMNEPQRSVKDLIQTFNRNDVKNLEVIVEEGEESGSGSWGRRNSFRKKV